MSFQKEHRDKLAHYRQRVNEDLARVAAAQKSPKVREMVRYALESGRRFRPLLLLLVYRVLGHKVDQQAYDVAIAIETFHKASLVHDDLIDGDAFRRGRQTFHQRYGSSNAVTAGDLLVAESGIRFCKATSGDADLTRMWLDQYRKLCYGEALDVIGEQALRDGVETADESTPTLGYRQINLGVMVCDLELSRPHEGGVTCSLDRYELTHFSDCSRECPWHYPAAHDQRLSLADAIV